MKLAIKCSGLMITLGFGATLASSQTYNTPLRHVIVIVQENRSTDNLFGSDLHNSPRLIPGADLASTGLCKTASPPNVTLVPAPLASCWDPDHEHGTSFNEMFDDGKMDDACAIRMFRTKGCPIPPHAQYQYVDNSTHLLDPYFNIAQNYGYGNYMFQTNQGPSFPAHQFLFSGTSAPVPYDDPSKLWTWFDSENAVGTTVGFTGCMSEAGAYATLLGPNNASNNTHYPCYDHPVLPDLLEKASPPLGWRWYGNVSAGMLWNAPNAISHICVANQAAGGNCVGPDWQPAADKVVLTMGRVLTDLGANPANQTCNLPAVSWVIPDGHWSDHPGGLPTQITDGGPSWVAAIVNAVGGYDNFGNPLAKKCDYWSNTAILITWDDWGGWYDHVLPWNCNSQGSCTGYANGTGAHYVYGFRVPFLIVSAYAKQGYVSGDVRFQSENPPYVHDFGSILNFIEFVFGQNSRFLGGRSGVGDPSYPYADVLAPDGPNGPNCFGQCPYGLSDFFDFRFQRPFAKIAGAKYGTQCFLTPSIAGCFAGAANFTPMEPDNDETDNDDTGND